MDGCITSYVKRSGKGSKHHFCGIRSRFSAMSGMHLWERATIKVEERRLFFPEGSVLPYGGIYPRDTLLITCMALADLGMAWSIDNPNPAGEFPGYKNTGRFSVCASGSGACPIQPFNL